MCLCFRRGHRRPADSSVSVGRVGVSSMGDHLDRGVVREGQGFAGWISCSGGDKSRSRHTGPDSLGSKIGGATRPPATLDNGVRVWLFFMSRVIY